MTTMVSEARRVSIALRAQHSFFYIDVFVWNVDTATSKWWAANASLCKWCFIWLLSNDLQKCGTSILEES